MCVCVCPCVSRCVRACEYARARVCLCVCVCVCVCVRANVSYPIKRLYRHVAKLIHTDMCGSSDPPSSPSPAFPPLSALPPPSPSPSPSSLALRVTATHWEDQPAHCPEEFLVRRGLKVMLIDGRLDRVRDASLVQAGSSCPALQDVQLSSGTSDQGLVALAQGCRGLLRADLRSCRLVSPPRRPPWRALCVKTSMYVCRLKAQGYFKKKKKKEQIKSRRKRKRNIKNGIVFWWLISIKHIYDIFMVLTKKNALQDLMSIK